MKQKFIFYRNFVDRNSDRVNIFRKTNFLNEAPPPQRMADWMRKYFGLLFLATNRAITVTGRGAFQWLIKWLLTNTSSTSEYELELRHGCLTVSRKLFATHPPLSGIHIALVRFRTEWDVLLDPWASFLHLKKSPERPHPQLAERFQCDELEANWKMVSTVSCVCGYCAQNCWLGVNVAL